MTTEPDRRLTPGGADALSALLASGFFTVAILQGAIPVLAPALRAEQGLSAARVGLLMSAFLAAYAAAQIPSGALAARRAGWVVAAGFAGMAAGSLLFAASSSYGGFVAARVLQGLAAGTMLPAAGVLLVRWVPLDRLGRAWAIYGGSSGLGYLVLLLALARVVEAGGYRAFFLVATVLVVAAGVVTFTSREVRVAPPATEARLTAGGIARDLRTLVRSWPVTLLGLTNVAGITVSVATLTWTPAYMHDELGAGLSAAAALTAGFAGAQLAGAPLAAYLVAKVGFLPLLVGVFAAMAVTLAMIPLVPGMVGAAVLVLVVGLLTTLAFAPSFALIPMVVEMRLVGLAGGYLNGFGFVGALFGPWLFGAFIDRGWGYGVGYAMLAAAAAVGVVTIAGLRRALTVR